MLYIFLTRAQIGSRKERITAITHKTTNSRLSYKSDKKRWERTVARGSARDHVTFEEFLELDKHEEEIFKTSVTMSMADYTFYRGDYPDEEYHDKIRKFYRERFM